MRPSASLEIGACNAMVSGRAVGGHAGGVVEPVVTGRSALDDSPCARPLVCGTRLGVICHCPHRDLESIQRSPRVLAMSATATVTFANLGKPTRLLIELEQTPAGWRIADIKAPSGSLRALYKLR